MDRDRQEGPLWPEGEPPRRDDQRVPEEAVHRVVERVIDGRDRLAAGTAERDRAGRVADEVDREEEQEERAPADLGEMAQRERNRHGKREEALEPHERVRSARV